MCWHAYCQPLYWFLCSTSLTYDNGVIRMTANYLLDLLGSSLSGGEIAIGVTVGVVQVQDVDGGAKAWLTKHGGSVSEVTWKQKHQPPGWSFTTCLKKCAVPSEYSDTDRCRVWCRSSLGRETWQIRDSGWHLLMWQSVSPCQCHQSAADMTPLSLMDGSTPLSPGGEGTQVTHRCM